MTFKEEVLAHYMDSEGLVTTDRDPGKWTTGNGLLYTGIFYSILALSRQADAADVRRFSDAVDPCWVGEHEGLLERNDGREDLQAHDDYIGVVAASYLLNTPHASKIESYGSKRCFNYNNVKPNEFSFRTWQGRFPGLIGFYRAAAKKEQGLIQKLGFSVTITSNALTSKEYYGSKILAWLRIQVIKQQTFDCRDAIEFWERRFRKDYGSLAALLAGYFGEKHVFARAPL